MSLAEELNYYASLIEDLGRSTLPNGKTLSEMLTIDGIPFWDVFSSELAWRHLTTAVAATTVFANAKLLVKPYALRLKVRLKRFIDVPRISNKYSKCPSAPNVLCLGFTKRMYRDVLEPVVTQLTAERSYKIVVLNDVSYFGDDQSANENVSYQRLEQHWSRDLELQLRALRLSVNQIEDELSSLNTLGNLLSKYDQHISVALRKVFYLLFRCYLPLILRQAVIAKHILSKQRVNVILSPDTSDPRTRIYTLLGKKMCIPSMEVQFGLTGDEGVEWRFLAADYVAVWGETSKNALLKQKVSEKKILITGSPRHDLLVEPSQSAISKIREGLRLTDKRPVILLASTYTDLTHVKFTCPKVLRAMKQAIFIAANRNPGIILLVKPHPAENTKETQRLAGDSNNIIFVDRESDIRNLIILCDAFLSFGSTSTIDALIAGKICICPAFPGWPFSNIFKDANVALTPKSPEQIQKIFFDISSGNNLALPQDLMAAREKYLNDVIYKADGLASERIRSHLVKMIE